MKESKLKKTIRKTAVITAIVGFVIITSGLWQWVHSFEHQHCDCNHKPVHNPDPENCQICHKLQFAVKSIEVNINSSICLDLNFNYHVADKPDQQIKGIWSGLHFTRRGPPSA